MHQPRPGEVRVAHLNQSQTDDFVQKIGIVRKLLDEVLETAVGFIEFVALAELLIGSVSLVGVLYERVHEKYLYLEIRRFVNFISRL